MNTTNERTTDLDALTKSLTDLGYTLEHTWYDSHGNGGQRIFQHPKTDATMCVAFDRRGRADGIFPGRPTDYRKAKEIRVELTQANPRYVKVGGDLEGYLAAVPSCRTRRKSDQDPAGPRGARLRDDP